MTARHEHRRSDLFLVRVWAQASEQVDGGVEWYGKVQSVADGRVRRFQGESELLKRLAEMLPNRDSSRDANPTDEQAGQ